MTARISGVWRLLIWLHAKVQNPAVRWLSVCMYGLVVIFPLYNPHFMSRSPWIEVLIGVRGIERANLRFLYLQNPAETVACPGSVGCCSGANAILDRMRMFNMQQTINGAMKV